MPTQNSVVAVYPTHTEADQAVKELQHRGVDMRKLSILGRGYHTEGLYSIGIPKDNVVKYEAALKTDQFLLIVHGTAAEVAKAKDIIETTHPAYFALHVAEVATAATV